MSRRAHTPPAAAFDWPIFAKLLPLQPVTTWLACALALRPLARATPRLLNAACSGPLRQGLVDTSLVVYVLVLPPAAAAAVYLLAGRRRMTPPLRRMGDWCLALILVVSAVNDANLVRRASAEWTTLRPGLDALRAACWK
jgi:hypothetical protein